jgi:maleylpyruvate isomerase
MTVRRDLATDPVLEAELLTARRGTAFFSRALDGLSDAELDEDSLLPGWNRSHVVAHVGYNARAIVRLIEWAGTGVETPMYESPEARSREITQGATLGAGALRELYDQSARHLNAEWRDLRAAHWSHPVKTAQGRIVPASETVWMRTREVWIHGVDLNTGATFADMPAEFLVRLLGDITAAWKSRGEDAGLLLSVSGAETPELGDLDAADPQIVSGSLADVTAWACGRGSAGVTSSTQDTPVAPRWL